MTQAEKNPLEVLAGAMLYGVVAALVRGGVPHTAAFRFASVSLIENACGPEVFADLGVPERTRKRWRSEVRKMLASGAELPDEPPAEMINALLKDLGSKYRVVEETEK